MPEPAWELFGYGTEHKDFRNMLGDYLAVATDDLSIFNTKEKKEKFVSSHGGLTEDEMIIPLIIVEKKQEGTKMDVLGLKGKKTKDDAEKFVLQYIKNSGLYMVLYTCQ